MSMRRSTVVLRLIDIQTDMDYFLIIHRVELLHPGG